MDWESGTAFSQTESHFMFEHVFQTNSDDFGRVYDHT